VNFSFLPIFRHFKCFNEKLVFITRVETKHFYFEFSEAISLAITIFAFSNNFLRKYTKNAKKNFAQILAIIFANINKCWLSLNFSEKSSVADPQWFQCRSRSASFLPDIWHEKYTYDVSNMSWACLRGTKAIMKGWKSRLFVNFGKFPGSWIQICIPNTDLDSGEPNFLEILSHFAKFPQIFRNFVISPKMCTKRHFRFNSNLYCTLTVPVAKKARIPATARTQATARTLAFSCTNTRKAND
jgi:hypothetical protein